MRYRPPVDPERTNASASWTYPIAPRADHVDDFHGVRVPDPYRPLEADGTAETQAWIAAQQALSGRYLAALPQRERFRQRLERLWDHPRCTAPERRGEWLFFRLNEGLQNQAVLYRQHAGADSELGAARTVVLDPNTLSEDGTTAVTVTSFSDDGRLLAYNSARSGSDWQRIEVLDVATGETLPDVIEWCKFGAAAWLPDASGFFYARYPAPGELPDAAPSTHQRVYFHRLGTPQQADRLAYARPDAPDLGFEPILTDDGHYLLLHVWQGTDRRNRVYYREVGGDGEFVRLLDEHDAGYTFIANDGPVFYFLTDLDAPNGRLVATDVREHGRGDARVRWREIVPEGDEAIDVSLMVAGRLVVAYLHHAHHRLRLFERDGTPLPDVELPGIGTLETLSGRGQDEAAFVVFQTFVQPPTVLRIDVAGATSRPFHEGALDFDASAYETRQVSATSADGTRVPLFLTHRRGLEPDGDHRTLLYGYGGFGVNMTPLFSPSRLAWLERGGIFAQAVLRGGGEYGEAWHQAGMLTHKQRVFDDFAAAARFLVTSGYTRPERLAIEGRSNGGLLVAACMTQRPELFGAVHCAVPVIDMLRYHRFTAGRYWVPEYGNAEDDPEAFRALLAYSPLHNVRPGERYPATLITTADTDDRVVPLHARKFAAALQAADAGGRPLLLRVERKAGHGLGKPTAKIIEEASDVLAFLWAALAGNDAAPPS